MDFAEPGDNPALTAHMLGLAYSTNSHILAGVKASPFYQTLHFFRKIPEQDFVACVRSWLLAVVSSYKVSVDENSVNYDKLCAITNCFEDILSTQHSSLLVAQWELLKQEATEKKLKTHNAFLIKTFDESMHFKYGRDLAKQKP